MASVQSLQKRDIRRALPAMVRSFWTYAEAVHLLPDESRRRRVLPRYLRSDMIDAASFGLLLGAVAENEIVGAAAWLPPAGYPVSTSRQLRQVLDLLPALPWALGAGREALRGQRENRRHHVDFPPHFYLRALGVDPDAQGHGHGAALLAPVLERADREHAGCFLTTVTRENTGWYERFGFAIASEYQPTDTWPTVWAMWRDPKT